MAGGADSDAVLTSFWVQPLLLQRWSLLRPGGAGTDRGWVGLSASSWCSRGCIRFRKEEAVFPAGDLQGRWTGVSDHLSHLPVALTVLGGPGRTKALSSVLPTCAAPGSSHFPREPPETG